MAGLDPNRLGRQGSAAGQGAVIGGERALVLGDDFGIFLAVARSLGRRGVEVHVVPAESDAPGLASRYVSALHDLPPYAEAPNAWVRALRDLIAAEDFRLVVPCSDSAVRILDRHADEIGRERLALANPAALAAFVDKAETRALAARLGVPVPRGAVIGAGDDAAMLAGQFGLPLVLKPRCSYTPGAARWKQPAQIVRDEATLRRALAEGKAGGWLAETFFPGEGVGLSVHARQGKVQLLWQHRRLREVSDTGASSARIGEPPDPVLVAHVEALAAATALDGVAMFEFRRDPATGEHVLLEVNPRFWGSLPLALAAGADFPGLVWESVGGRPHVPGPIRREGVVRYGMTAEFDRISNRIEAADSAIARWCAFAGLLSLAARLVRRSAFDSWAGDDPTPFRAERRLLARRLVGALLRRAPFAQGESAVTSTKGTAS